MVTEQVLGEVFVKIYSAEKNKHLLFLLPGQSLSPRAFWDFELPEGKTHCDYFLQSGIDVVLFDPVGYGKSEHFYPYDRVAYAQQIHSVVSSIKKQYESKTIFGFSTTTAPALIASQTYFDKVIIHSPALKTDRKWFVIHDAEFNTGIEKLKTERLAKISDRLIPKPNRIDGWEERILSTIGKSEWKVPAQVVYDINNYWVMHRNHGFSPDRIPPILSIIGEYDYESTTGGYSEFRKVFTDVQEVIIPESTHFSMWENQSCRTRAEMVKYCLTNIQ